MPGHTSEEHTLQRDTNIRTSQAHIPFRSDPADREAAVAAVAGAPPPPLAGGGLRRPATATHQRLPPLRRRRPQRRRRGPPDPAPTHRGRAGGHRGRAGNHTRGQGGEVAAPPTPAGAVRSTVAPVPSLSTKHGSCVTRPRRGLSEREHLVQETPAMSHSRRSVRVKTRRGERLPPRPDANKIHRPEFDPRRSGIGRTILNLLGARHDGQAHPRGDRRAARREITCHEA